MKLAIGGFSMGGALSLYVASRKIAGSYSDGKPATDIPELTGAICLSGWLPNAA